MSPIELWEDFRECAVGLAVKRHNWSRFLNLDDLKQAALLTTWEAALVWDPTRGVPWRAFARERVQFKLISESWRQNFWGYNASDYANRGGPPLPKRLPVDPNWLDLCEEKIPFEDSRELLAHIIGLLPNERLRMVARRYWVEGLHIDTIAHQLGKHRSRAQQLVRQAYTTMVYLADRLKREWGEAA